MRVLALDFDGVLCDSSREVLVVAVDAYAALQPASALLPELRAIRGRALAGDGSFRGDPLYRRFAELLPLGNRAEDFGVALWAIDRGLQVLDQAGYDAAHRRVGGAWRDAFHDRFYTAREALRAADLEGWRRLHLPYPSLADTLRRRGSAWRCAVATAKDGRSVRLLLADLGLEGVIDPALILDKETGVDKTSHLTELSARAGAPFAVITFVDDKVNHLQKAASLGVRTVLAGWGFNTPREHDLARALGYPVASLATAGEILFDGA
jgi:phosphoglycolate phosphatase-like HAD superfamily hydrolase